jgi:hypothetical protein
VRLEEEEDRDEDVEDELVNRRAEELLAPANRPRDAELELESREEEDDDGACLP